MKKIGITEPDVYVKSTFQDQTIKYMTSSCFASYFFDQIEGEIEEGLNRNGFCDLSQLLPSVLNAKDSSDLLVIFEKNLQNTPLESIIMADSYLVSKKFLKAVGTKFQSKMEENSEADLKKPNYVLAFRTEHAIVGGSQNIYIFK